jgi:hypothetical protein
VSVPFIPMCVRLNERGMSYTKVDRHTAVTCYPIFELLIQHDRLGGTFG